MKTAKTPSALMIALALVLAVFVGQSSAISYPQKVLVLPFKMNAPENMAYLQQGIVDILHSNLAWGDKIQLVSKSEAQKAFQRSGGQVDEAGAKGLASGYKATFILLGTATVIGQNVSLDAALVDVSGKVQPFRLKQQTGVDGVIPTVTRYAQDINAKVFGRSGGAAAGGTGPAAGAPRAGGKPAPGHPTYSLVGEEGKALSPLNPNFIAAPGGGRDQGKFWRSQSLPVEIIGLDVGDIDGDGTNEVAYAGDQVVYVARLAENMLQVIASFEGETTDRFLTLDVADINHNGHPEIFVSNQRGFRAASYVLEMSGGKLTPILKDANWYYRVFHSGSTPMLMGQEGGTGELFFGPVKELQFSGGEYKPVKTLNIPEEYNIFRITTARLTSGGVNLVGVTDKEKLVVMSSGGQEVWSSKDFFAGSTVYVQEPRGIKDDSALGQDDKEPIRTWLPTRILVADLDGDGLQEILVPQNERKGTRMLAGVRIYDQGSLYSLRFTHRSMKEEWHTQPQQGHLADYKFADLDNDGRKDLVVGTVIKHSEGMFSSKSAIVIYDIAPPAQGDQGQ